MNIYPHATDYATDPDAENKTSARQLLDGQEYHVAKIDILKRGFDQEAAVEQFVAYLHSLSQLPVCPRYTSNIITYFTYFQLLSIEKMIC